MALLCFIWGTFSVHDLASAVIRKLTYCPFPPLPASTSCGFWLAFFSARCLLLHPKEPSPSPCEPWDLHVPTTCRLAKSSPSASQPWPKTGVCRKPAPWPSTQVLGAQGIARYRCSVEMPRPQSALQSWQETFKVIFDISGVRVPFFTLHGAYTSSLGGI